VAVNFKYTLTNEEKQQPTLSNLVFVFFRVVYEPLQKRKVRFNNSSLILMMQQQILGKIGRRLPSPKLTTIVREHRL